MQPVAAQPLVTVTKPHGAHGDGVKHRRIIARAWRRRKLSRYYALVPDELRMGAYLATVKAQLEASARHRRRYLPAVREILKQRGA